MIESEEIITLAEYFPIAEECDEPYLIAKESTLRSIRVLTTELAQRGFPEAAVAEGLSRALAEFITETYGQKN